MRCTVRKALIVLLTCACVGWIVVLINLPSMQRKQYHHHHQILSALPRNIIFIGCGGLHEQLLSMQEHQGLSLRTTLLCLDEPRQQSANHHSVSRSYFRLTPDESCGSQENSTVAAFLKKFADTSAFVALAQPPPSGSCTGRFVARMQSHVSAHCFNGEESATPQPNNNDVPFGSSNENILYLEDNALLSSLYAQSIHNKIMGAKGNPNNHRVDSTTKPQLATIVSLQDLLASVIHPDLEAHHCSLTNEDVQNLLNPKKRADHLQRPLTPPSNCPKPLWKKLKRRLAELTKEYPNHPTIPNALAYHPKIANLKQEESLSQDWAQTQALAFRNGIKAGRELLMRNLLPAKQAEEDPLMVGNNGVSPAVEHINNPFARKAFMFFPGLDSMGEEMLTYASGSLEELEELCNEILECVGFNTNGQLKKVIRRKEQWKDINESTDAPRDRDPGLYVVAHHPCDMDMHHCDKNANCVKTGIGSYTCMCNERYEPLGHKCIPWWGEDDWTRKHNNDVLDILDYPFHEKQAATFVAFPHTDTSPSHSENFLFVPRAPHEHDEPYLKRLLNICKATIRCIAFSSQGFLKSEIGAPSTWIEDSSNNKEPSTTLYVMDFDYCSLNSQGCPPEASCRRSGAGLYGCTCDDSNKVIVTEVEAPASSNIPIKKCVKKKEQDNNNNNPDSKMGMNLLLSNKGNIVEGRGDKMAGGKEEKSIQKKRSSIIHIVFSVDELQIEGIAPCINSIRRHSSVPGRLHFHILAPNNNNNNNDNNNNEGIRSNSNGEPALSEVIQSYLACHMVESHVIQHASDSFQSWFEGLHTSPRTVLIHSMDAPLLFPAMFRDVHVLNDRSGGHLNSAANFARFLIPELFQALADEVVYLDADVIVRGDVSEMVDGIVFGDEDVMAAVPRDNPSYKAFFDERVQVLYQQDVEHTATFLDMQAPTFNAGVLVIRPKLWVDMDITGKIITWMKLHKEHHLWDYGTQPLLLLAGYNRWAPIHDTRWNVDKLGYKTDISSDVLVNAKLLHWTGPGKPWASQPLYKDLWLPFVPIPCSGHGSCTPQHNEGDSITSMGALWGCHCHVGYAGPLCKQGSSP